jgi:hypothetical protein
MKRHEIIGENPETLKVARDDEKQTILQNPATGVQTQIDKTNPNAPTLTQDEQGHLKLQTPVGGGAQSPDNQNPNLIGKDVKVATENVKDLGNGETLKTNPDGTTEHSGAWGTKIYSADGRLLKTIGPRFAGVQQTSDASGQPSSTNYQQGPMSVTKNADGSGTANYDLGVGVAQQQTDAQEKTSSNLKMRTGESLNDLLKIAGLR